MKLQKTSEDGNTLKDVDNGKFYSNNHTVVKQYLKGGGKIAPAPEPVAMTQDQKNDLLKPLLQDKLFMQEKKRLAAIAVDDGELEQQISIDDANDKLVEIGNAILALK